MNNNKNDDIKKKYDLRQILLILFQLKQNYLM